MIRAAILVLTLAFSAASLTVASAEESSKGTRSEAVAMVKRVKEMFALQGKEATFAAIDDATTPAFHDRDLYPFVYDLQGVNVAHGARPVLVGKNLSSLKDQDGKYLIQEIVRVAVDSGSGWVDYKWPHPITDNIEDKSSYIERMGAYVVGVGVHRD